MESVCQTVHHNPSASVWMCQLWVCQLGVCQSAMGVSAVGVSAVGVLSISSHCPRVSYSQFSGLVHAATREVLQLHHLLIKQNSQNHFVWGKYFAINAWHQHSHLVHAVSSTHSLNFSILTTTSLESIKFQSTHISEITVETTILWLLMKQEMNGNYHLWACLPLGNRWSWQNTCVA